MPRSEGVENKSFSTFDSAPEKLLHVDLSLISFSTVDFGSKVKFPYLIDFPVKNNVKNLWKKYPILKNIPYDLFILSPTIGAPEW